MTAVDLEDRTRAVIESWNRKAWSTYRALTCADFVHEELGTGWRTGDVDEVVARWRRITAAYPDTSAEVVTVEQRAPWTVAGVVWRAVELGSYKRLQVSDVIMMEWSAGLVALERHHTGFLSLLAALPHPPGAEHSPEQGAEQQAHQQRR